MTNSPPDKVGEASGLYKMASSLGGSFGVAISAAVYEALSATGRINMAAAGGIITNVIFGVLALVSIVALVPGTAGKGGKGRATPAPTFYKKGKEKAPFRRQRATD